MELPSDSMLGQLMFSHGFELELFNIVLHLGMAAPDQRCYQSTSLRTFMMSY